LIYNPRETIYKERNISAELLRHLQFIGLILFTEGTYIQRFPSSPRLVIEYQGTRLELELPSSHKAFPIGRVELTQAGRELTRLCRVERLPGYVEMMLDKLTSTRSPVTKQNGSSALNVRLLP
jgi:hypothetical protein